MASSVIPAIFLAALLSSTLTPSVCEKANFGEVSKKLDHVNLDPLGDKDIFTQLSDVDKHVLSKSEEHGTESKKKFLKSLEVDVSVDIRLVGFDGDGNTKIKLSESELGKYLELLKSSVRVPVIHGNSHELDTKTKLLFHVSRTPSLVAAEISGLLKREVQKATESNATGLDPPVTVSHLIVDRVVASDYEHSAAADGYTIYIMNPEPQNVPYIYSYEDEKDCPGSFFASKHRYLWIDLTAGPFSYGPVEHGEGLASNSSFVQPGSRPTRGTLEAHLVSLVASATQHFVAPSFLHFPIPFALHTQVRVIHFQAGKSPSSAAGIDLEAIQKQLYGPSTPKNVVLSHQVITFNASSLPFSACSFCSLALARSLKGGGMNVGSLPAAAGHIDSMELNQLLIQYWPQIKELAGIEDPDFMRPEVVTTGRVIPLFLLDLDTDEPILLDGTHQAVAFDNMVIAVRSQSALYPSRYQCQGKLTKFDLTDPTRPALAALLQTGWGVTPPHVAWSPLHNRTVKEYRWSVGPTPFGPFSHSLHVSFAQRDAALRNILYSLLNDTVADVMHTLDLVAAYGGEDLLLRASKKSKVYNQRWNLLKLKMAQGIRAFSHVDFDRALYFFRSARHDVASLYNVVAISAEHVQTTLSCFKEDHSEWLLYSALLVLGFGVGIALANLDSIFSSKLKQF